MYTYMYIYRHVYIYIYTKPYVVLTLEGEPYRIFVLYGMLKSKMSV